LVEIDWAKVPVRELKQSSRTRKGQGFLYIDDMDWIRQAYEATKSKAQFAYALLLHRHCRVRKQAGEYPAVAGRAVQAGFGISHDAATRSLRRLEQAGLVQVERRPGSAYRVSILATAGRFGNSAPDQIGTDRADS
jgi:DNA-binding transcriptional ArsR family regulator